MILHLTGSRFFGNARTDSDYDYIGEYSPENLEGLIKTGYSLQCAFLTKPEETIILVNNLEKYLAARERLYELPLKDYPRWQHGYLWKKALENIGG
jgi:hypothetical protein